MFSFYRTWFSATVVALVLGACAPVYNPNAVYTPLYTDQGEMHAAAYLGTHGFDTYVSYSPWQHVAVAAAVSLQERSDSTFKSTRNYGELAVGYYLEITDVGRIDVFAGAGTGTSTSQVDVGEFSYAYGRGWLKKFSGSFNRYFIQTCIGMPVETDRAWLGIKEIESGVALRASYVDFYDITHIDSESGFIDNAFFEPTFFIRSGWEYAKLEMQAGVSFPLAERVAYDWQLIHMALGVHIVLGKRDKPVPGSELPL